MADEHNGGGGSALGELVVLCIALFILILFWFASGRPNADSLGSLFVKSPLAASLSTTTETPAVKTNWLPFWNPETASQTSWQPAPQYQGGNFGGIPAIPALAHFAPSPAGGEVLIQDYSAARSSVPSQEYIVIYASSANPGPITLSGWQLRSPITGRGAYIGGGIEVPHPGEADTLQPIKLNPGDSAVITTGRSPIGASFRENECSGYLAQFQYFTPSFTQGCPLPQDDLARYGSPQDVQDYRCIQAVAGLSSCQAAIGAPAGVTSSCSDFITQHFTYSGCVATHQSDQNFLGRRWRVYLGQDSEMWSNTGDVIALFDESGRLVTAVTY